MVAIPPRRPYKERRMGFPFLSVRFVKSWGINTIINIYNIRNSVGIIYVYRKDAVNAVSNPTRRVLPKEWGE